MTTATDIPGTNAPILSAAELRDLLTDPEQVAVDVRATAAYNGWRLNGEARGGHIPGAVAFPVAWLSSIEDAEIERLLAAKGIGPGRPVIVYGDDAGDATTFKAWLEGAGHAHVRIFEPGFAAWAADASLPVERLPNYDKLVHPDWVRQLIDGERRRPPRATPSCCSMSTSACPRSTRRGTCPEPSTWTRTGSRTRMAGTGARPPRSRRPCAGWASPGTRRWCSTVATPRATPTRSGRGDGPDRSRPAGRRSSCATPASTTFACSTGATTAGSMRDTRSTRSRAGRHRSPASGLAIPERPELIVDIGEAKSILADENAAAWSSVRTWREHIGEVSGYNYIGPAGRIAGDVWGNCGTDAYHMQHYRNVDNTMRAYPEIAANWAEAGITSDKWVAFYCGTGWRAAETWFYAYLLDWSRIAVYDGGWFEWSQDPDNNPIVVGQPEDEAAA